MLADWRLLAALSLAALILPVSAPAQSQREQLTQMVEQLQKNPSDNSLRERIVKLAAEIKPAPAVPEEANRSLIRGNVFQKEAKDSAGYDLAVTAYREALRVAPWWGDAYFNLAIAQELSGKPDDAIASLRFFMLGSPSAQEMREAQNRIYALEAKKELAVKTQEDARIVPGQRIGRIAIGMAPGRPREILGEPSETSNIGAWWQNYTWKSAGLFVSVKASLNAVDEVAARTGGTSYRTAEGLGVGSPESEIRARMGTPQRSGRIRYEAANMYCYRSGIGFSAKNGTVDFVRVFRAAAFDETYCEARWFEQLWTNN